MMNKWYLLKLNWGLIMEIIYIRKSQLKAITLFLIERKIIFHPIISQDGCPDFTDREGFLNTLIIDRNIMTKIVEFCRTGLLKDPIYRKVISALIIWARFNDISISCGLAQIEYANTVNSSHMASSENEIFLNMMEHISPKIWLDVFEDKQQTINPIKCNNENSYNFLIEDQHYKMHLVEIIHLYCLYLDTTISEKEKMIRFIRWIDENLLFCSYTITYACMLFTTNVKKPKFSKSCDYKSIEKASSNQAWDLTYLSLWSTLYWEEADEGKTYLFATMDKDIKKVFFNTHDVSSKLFIRFFGSDNGGDIDKCYNEIRKNRTKPVISDELIEKLLEIEKKRLSMVVCQN